MKSSICIQTYMYHLVAARETTASLLMLAGSLQVDFNMVKTGTY